VTDTGCRTGEWNRGFLHDVPQTGDNFHRPPEGCGDFGICLEVRRDSDSQLSRYVQLRREGQSL